MAGWYRAPSLTLVLLRGARDCSDLVQHCRGASPSFDGNVPPPSPRVLVNEDQSSSVTIEFMVWVWWSTLVTSLSLTLPTSLRCSSLANWRLCSWPKSLGHGLRIGVFFSVGLLVHIFVHWLPAGVAAYFCSEPRCECGSGLACKWSCLRRA
eukprot:1548531-Amphidinium_carterae.1